MSQKIAIERAERIKEQGKNKGGRRMWKDRHWDIIYYYIEWVKIKEKQSVETESKRSAWRIISMFKKGKRRRAEN